MRVFLAGLALAGLMAVPALACVVPPKAPAAKAPVATADAAIAAIGTQIDGLLAKAQLAPDAIAQVRDLQTEIAALVAARKIKEARIAEAKAMRLLGFRKVLPHCGPGSFMWVKQG
jgi:hypothetical protein